ncbi:hypothetical protein ElyMa_004579300 [Elysia marginata]|uniref:Uncharacterized protein n=1 Tax=Elysia marginata TaxID=1093978 RepID=A0AAV4HUC4_9GAST|nr:hypothetical protein ElyMa_004579300 [Elysia marginata]
MAEQWWGLTLHLPPTATTARHIHPGESFWLSAPGPECEHNRRILPCSRCGRAWPEGKVFVSGKDLKYRPHTRPLFPSPRLSTVLYIGQQTRTVIPNTQALVSVIIGSHLDGFLSISARPPPPKSL